jgi:predicted transcriptional regulator
MVANRQQLHDIIDVVDQSELNVLYHVLIKFMPETEPLPDEVEAIRKGREEILRGEVVSHEDIDWG